MLNFADKLHSGVGTTFSWSPRLPLQQLGQQVQLTVARILFEQQGQVRDRDVTVTLVTTMAPQTMFTSPDLSSPKLLHPKTRRLLQGLELGVAPMQEEDRAESSGRLPSSTIRQEVGDLITDREPLPDSGPLSPFHVTPSNPRQKPGPTTPKTP